MYVIYTYIHITSLKVEMDAWDYLMLKKVTVSKPPLFISNHVKFRGCVIYEYIITYTDYSNRKIANPQSWPCFSPNLMQNCFLNSPKLFDESSSQQYVPSHFHLIHLSPEPKKNANLKVPQKISGNTPLVEHGRMCGARSYVWSTVVCVEHGRMCGARLYLYFLGISFWSLSPSTIQSNK